MTRSAIDWEYSPGSRETQILRVRLFNIVHEETSRGERHLGVNYELADRSHHYSE
jgi:hypothetical protein